MSILPEASGASSPLDERPSSSVFAEGSLTKATELTREFHHGNVVFRLLAGDDSHFVATRHIGAE